MTRIFVGALAIATAVAMGALIDLPVIGQGGPEAPPEEPTRLEAPNRVASPDLPQLSKTEIAQAEAILRADPRAANLPGYRIGGFGPWIDEKNTVIGAGILLSLANPVPAAAIKGAWLGVRFDPSSPSGYVSVPEEITDDRLATELRNQSVQDFHVLVDLKRGQIVEFYPLFEPLPMPSFSSGTSIFGEGSDE